MNESNLIIHWPISTLEAILRSNLSDNCLLCKFFKITEIMSMLDPTLSKRQSYMLSHRGVLKISSCEVLQKTSEKMIVKMSFLTNMKVYGNIKWASP